MDIQEYNVTRTQQVNCLTHQPPVGNSLQVSCKLQIPSLVCTMYFHFWFCSQSTNVQVATIVSQKSAHLPNSLEWVPTLEQSLCGHTCGTLRKYNLGHYAHWGRNFVLYFKLTVAFTYMYYVHKDVSKPLNYILTFTVYGCMKTNIHTHLYNALPPVWGLLKLCPVT